MEVPYFQRHRGVSALWTFFLVVIPCLGGKIGEIRRLLEDGVHWEPMFDIPRGDSPDLFNVSVRNSDDVPIFVGIASFRDGEKIADGVRS